MDLRKIRWFYLGWEHYDKHRKEIRELLARREDWFGDSGRITEMVINSVPHIGF